MAVTDLMATPVQQPKSSARAWVMLTAGTFATFILGAIAQVLVYLGLGLCTEADQGSCAAGTVPTGWETALATVPTYLLWVAPSIIAAILGWRSMRSGNRAGTVVAVVAVLAAVAITIGCTLVWWV